MDNNYYKVGQVLTIKKWGNVIYKVGQFSFKVGWLLQSGTIITMWSLTPCGEALSKLTSKDGMLDANHD